LIDDIVEQAELDNETWRYFSFLLGPWLITITPHTPVSG
jgi:hypothetical protein